MGVFVGCKVLARRSFCSGTRGFTLFASASNGRCAFRRCRALVGSGRASGSGGLVCLCTGGGSRRFTCVRTTGGGNCGILLVSKRLSITVMDVLRRGLRGSHFAHMSDSIISGLVIGRSGGDSILRTSGRRTLSTTFGDRLPGVRGIRFGIVARTLNRGNSPIVVARDRCVHHVGRVTGVRTNVDFCNRVPSVFGLMLGSSRGLIGRMLTSRRGRYDTTVTPVRARLRSIAGHHSTLGGGRRNGGSRSVPATRGSRLGSLSGG